MKKSLLALSILTSIGLTSITIADYIAKVPLEQNNGGGLPNNSIVFKNLDTWSLTTPIISGWVDVGSYYCLSWIPLENTRYTGVSFTQTGVDCKQNQERTVQQQEISNKGIIRDAGSLSTETQIITATGLTRQATGSAVGWEAFAVEKGLDSDWNDIFWSGNSLTNIPTEPYPLTSVSLLNISYNRLTNVAGLSNLTSANFLQLDNNRLTNVDELSNLTSVGTLYLYNNQLTSVEGLRNLTSVTVYLSLNNNQLTNVDGLRNLTSVDFLELDNNQLKDVNGLINLTSVNRLHLHSNQLTNLDGLSNVKVNNNIIIDITYAGPKLAATTRFCTENSPAVFQSSYAGKNKICL